MVKSELGRFREFAICRHSSCAQLELVCKGYIGPCVGGKEHGPVSLGPIFSDYKILGARI